MKVDLSTAKMTAAILALASSALVGTNAMAAPSGNAPPASAVHVPQASPTPVPPLPLQCTAIGNDITIYNVGDAPIPAGAVTHWQVPKKVVSLGSLGGFTLDFHSENYTFQTPLAPKGKIQLNAPKGNVQLNAPSPTTGSGGNPDPATEVAGGVLGLAAIRPCTISAATPVYLSPVRMQVLPH